MSFVKHTSCSSCGSSDAFALYIDSDGHESGHCFSCQFTIPSKDYIEEKDSKQVKPKKVNMEKETEVKSTKPAITLEEAAKIKAETFATGNSFRGISDSTYSYFGVRHSLSEDEEVIEQYYPCTQEGQLVGYKVREVPKNFYSKGRTGADCELFMQFRFNRGGKYVLLVEGEVDSLSAYQMLKEYNTSRGSDFETAVVSPTTGANSKKQIAAHYKFLDSFDQIICCLDNDKAGKEATEEIIKYLPKGKVKLMKMKYKDPNEYLMKGDSRLFINDFYNAESYTPVGVLSSDKLYDAILQQNQVEKVPFPPFLGKLNEMTANGMPLGHIVNIAADTSIGKTTFVNSMVEYWIFNSPHTVGVVSMELDDGQYGESLLSQYIQRKLALISDVNEKLDYLRSDKVKAKADELFKKPDGSPRFYLLDNRDGSVEEIQDTVEELVVSCGCRVIILDPLQDILDGLSNEEQASFMKWAKGFIKSHKVLFILINHMRKAPSGQTGNDNEQSIMGSSTIIKSASLNIILKRDKMAEDAIVRNTTEILVPKNRLCGITGPAGDTYYDNGTHTLHNLTDWQEVHGVKDF